MRRKIIRQGSGAFTITLPKKWAVERNLDKESELEVSETDSGLLIGVPKVAVEKRAEIILETKNRYFLRYALTNHYRAGYDKIVLKGHVNKTELKNTLSMLEGLEVERLSDDLVELEMLAEPNMDNRQDYMKKMFFILNENSNHILGCFEQGKSIDIPFIKENNVRIAKYFYIMMRSVSKKVSELNSFYQSLVNLLFWSAKRLQYLSEALESEKPLKLEDKKHMAYIKEVASSIDLLYDGVYRSDLKSISRIYDQEPDFAMLFSDMYKKPDRRVIVILHNFMILHRNIISAAGEIIGMIALRSH